MKKKVTIVTGIWDIKRDTLSEGWSRSFEHYLNNLAKLMKTDDNMIIYIEEKYTNKTMRRTVNITSSNEQGETWLRGCVVLYCVVL